MSHIGNAITTGFEFTVEAAKILLGLTILVSTVAIPIFAAAALYKYLVS